MTRSRTRFITNDRHFLSPGLRNMIPKEYRHSAHHWLLSGRARVYAYAMVRPVIRAEMVTRKTVLVLEGYPRSANSYALNALLYTNATLKVAHHLHSPVSVEMGVRRGIPTAVLLRHPVDAVASLLQTEEGFSAKNELRRYASFYEQVEPLTSAIVIAPFEVVVADFGRIIEWVNEKFGTSFKMYLGTDEDEIAVHEMVDHMDGLQSLDGQPREEMVSRPSAVRHAKKAAFVEQIMQCGPELESAKAIYRRLVNAQRRGWRP